MTAPTPAPVPILAGLASDALALERFGDGGAHRIRTAADRKAVERHRQAAGALDPSRLLDRADDPSHDRAGRHDHAVPSHQVDQRRRLETVFDLRGCRAERCLQPHVELRADGNVEVAADRSPGGGRRTIVAFRRAGWRARPDGDFTAGAAADRVDPIAQVEILVAGDPLVLPELDLQIDALVARVVELALELGRQRPVARREAATRPVTRRKCCPAGAGFRCC